MEGDRPRDVMGNVHFQFLPPNSTGKWPNAVMDIGNEIVTKLLKEAGNGAVGSITLHSYLLTKVLSEGVVYTDDCLFWLSKANLHSRLRFVYGISYFTESNNLPGLARGEESEEFETFGSFVKWTYIDQHPLFVRPKEGTTIVFEDLWDWNNFKQKFHMPWLYPKEEDHHGENDPPPPYQP